MKRILLAIAVLIGVVLILGGIYASNIMAMIKAGEAMSGPMPDTVQLRAVESDQWSERLRAVGSLSAIEGTMIGADADGRVVEIRFSAGQRVEAGDLLVKLDTEVEEAQLAVAAAAAKLAKADVERARELHRRAGISDSELEAAEATYTQSTANVANLEAVLRLKTIRAPFGGVLGVQRISLGDFLNRGEPVVSLQALEHIRADFTVSQRDVAFVHEGMVVELRVDSFPGDVFTGKVTALDPNLDPQTRTLAVQADFSNEDMRLRPGMFAQIELLKDEARKVLLVPQSAILFATFGDTLFVAKDAGESGLRTVEQRIVELGETRGDFIEVTKGLSGGEEVVVSGAFKLRDGSHIVHSDVGTVEPQREPKPANQ